MTLPKLIEQKFLAWQTEQGRRMTLDDYAEYLGVGRSVLSNWLTGKRSPSSESLRVLSSKLGPEVYDVLELERPDPDLAFIEQQWQNLSPKVRKQLRAQAEKFVTDNESRRVHRTRRTRAAD